MGDFKARNPNGTKVEETLPLATASVTSTQVSDQNTIVSTSDRVTRDTGWFDPLAQTFMLQQEGGAFITSVDLFFESKDDKIPMRIEIREVVNGYPGAAVIPFSRVEKKAASIITSTDSTIATTFTFSSPVFLQNGIEYALVALFNPVIVFNVFTSKEAAILDIVWAEVQVVPSVLYSQIWEENPDEVFWVA